MPHQETAYRRQTAVLWECTGKDRTNEPILSSPREIKVRWNNDQSSMLDESNTVVRVDALVETTCDVPVDSILWLGCLEDWYGTGSGSDESQLMQVRLFQKTPDLKGRAFYRRAGLLRFRGVLPTGG